MTDTNPLGYIHQVVNHQLRHAQADIQEGDGLVVDFDYDEEVNRDFLDSGYSQPRIQKERIVTLELTYILPE